MSMLLSQFVPAYSSPAVSTSPFFTSESLWRQPQGQRDCSFERSHQGQCSKFPPSGPHSIGISSHFCAVCQCSHHWLFPISIYKCLVLSSLNETPLLTAHSSPSASSMLLPFSVLKGSSIPIDSTSSPAYYLENGHKNTTYQSSVIQPKSFLEINSSPSTCSLILKCIKSNLRSESLAKAEQRRG